MTDINVNGAFYELSHKLKQLVCLFEKNSCKIVSMGRHLRTNTTDINCCKS